LNCFGFLGNWVKPELVEGVPKEIHDAIWTENASFMKERQVFDTVYFDFLLRLLTDLKFDPVLTFDAEKYTNGSTHSFTHS